MILRLGRVLLRHLLSHLVIHKPATLPSLKVNHRKKRLKTIATAMSKSYTVCITKTEKSYLSISLTSSQVRPAERGAACAARHDFAVHPSLCGKRAALSHVASAHTLARQGYNPLLPCLALRPYCAVRLHRGPPAQRGAAPPHRLAKRLMLFLASALPTR